MNRGEYPGLYVHVPFCRSKCLYCDFYSIASLAAVPEWLRAVRTEALLYKEKFHTFDSLFLGGGTPSILDERDLASLLHFLRTLFAFRPDSEISLEANPDGLSGRKLDAIRDMGINRISLGVQSLDDRDLNYLGRSHTSEQALESLDMIRSRGFAALSVDLMYGLETQTLRGWRTTVDRILRFEPEHISCYQLTIAERTPFWKRVEEGRIRPVEERLQRAFFIWTSRYLEKHGYIHYEISNFARSTESMCRHNRKYWGHVPYLGLGPSAHSFQAGNRWWNVASVKKYCRLLAEGTSPVEDREELTEEQFELESLFLGLRTRDGIALETVRSCAGWQKNLEELRKSGLVTVTDGRIRPTRKGFLVADSLPLCFRG